MTRRQVFLGIELATAGHWKVKSTQIIFRTTMLPTPQAFTTDSTLDMTQHTVRAVRAIFFITATTTGNTTRVTLAGSAPDVARLTDRTMDVTERDPFLPVLTQKRVRPLTVQKPILAIFFRRSLRAR